MARVTLTLAQTLAAVRECGCRVSHDGEGDLKLVRRVPGTLVPRPVLDALAAHRDALGAACRVCGAAVYMPCSAGAACDRGACPYREAPAGAGNAG